jgi:hypothetical protein
MTEAQLQRAAVPVPVTATLAKVVDTCRLPAGWA